MSLDVYCSTCGVHITLRDQKESVRLNCPKCGGRIKLSTSEPMSGVTRADSTVAQPDEPTHPHRKLPPPPEDGDS